MSIMVKFLYLEITPLRVGWVHDFGMLDAVES